MEWLKRRMEMADESEFKRSIKMGIVVEAYYTSSIGR
jgi:hypothetical protein